MSEETEAAPKKGLAIWAVSGTVALVMLIGGAVAFSSANRSVEESNPRADQTVAPRASVAGTSTAPAGSTSSSSAPIPPGGATSPAVTDPTADPGTAGTDAEQPSDPGAAGTGRSPGGPAPAGTADPAAVPGRDPGAVLAREASATPPAPAPAPDAPAPDAAVPGEPPVLQPTTEPPAGGTEPTTAPGGSEPVPPGGGTEPVTPPGVGTEPPPPPTIRPPAPAPTPRFTDPTAAWSSAGDRLDVGVTVPSAPGVYTFTVTVDGRPFNLEVTVGASGQVSTRTFNGAPNPFRVSGRTILAELTPRDFGYVEQRFPSRAEVDASVAGASSGGLTPTLEPSVFTAAPASAPMAPDALAAPLTTPRTPTATVAPATPAATPTPPAASTPTTTTQAPRTTTATSSQDAPRPTRTTSPRPTTTAPNSSAPRSSGTDGPDQTPATPQQPNAVTSPRRIRTVSRRRR